MIRLQILSRIILIGLLCGVGFLYSQLTDAHQQVETAVAATVTGGVHVGQEAHPIELTSLRGEKKSLSDYKGQLVVLNFFATWCYPCQEEMPVIVEMEKRLRAEGGVLLAINLTSEENDKSDVGLKQFLSHYKADFDPLLDINGEVLKKYQIIGIPTTIVIDKEGKIVQRINGELSIGMIDKLIFSN